MKSHLIQLGDIAVIPESIACIEPLELDAQHGCKLHLSIPPHQIDTNLGLKEIMDILNSEKTMEPVPVTSGFEDPEHNPDNVPPEKIPAGYRLARRSEVDNCFHEDSMYWDGNGCFRTQSKSKGCIRWKHNTIIIPINP